MSQATLEVREEVRRRVDRGIRGFEDWYRRVKGDLYLEAEETEILAALDLDPTHTLIDAGCGGGRFTLLAAPRCRWVRAVDLSSVAVETTVERSRSLGLRNVSPHVADLVDGLGGIEPADRVLCVQAIQHIPTASDRLQAVKSLLDSLRPDGRLVVSVFNGGRFMDQIRGKPREFVDQKADWLYYYRFLAGELSGLLKLAGLREVRVRSLLNLPGRVYQWPTTRALLPLDRLLGRSPIGRGLGIYLLATGRR